MSFIAAVDSMMKKALLTGIAALFLATGTSVEATETTLTCKGTVGPGMFEDDPRPQNPVSIGVIINLANKTFGRLEK
jgi:hypothetical protein